MPFEVGELNEWYVNIDRVGPGSRLDLYEFSHPGEGSFNISVQPLQAPVSVELLDNFGNVLSAVNASELDGGELFFENLNQGDYRLKISSIGDETPYRVSISPDGEGDPITDWGITEGFFVADATGEVGVDYLLDGGSYQGELAIFSLKGMEDLSLGSSEFITEAASRALSNSTLGHVVISDASEGAKFSSWNNSGEYLGRETFSMSPGDVFAVMLVPNGKVQEVYDNPGIGGNKRPLFSLATANPSDAFHVGQISDVTGSGSAFVMEDLRVDTGSDRDYNDIIWQFSGAVGLAMPVEELIAPEKDWRSSEVGQELLNAIASVPLVDSEAPEEPVVASAPEPVVASAPEPVVASAPEPVVASAPEPVVASAPEPVVASAPEPVVASNEPVAEVAPPVENEATSHESQDDGANSHQENLAAESENSSPDLSDTETDTEIDPPTVPEVTEDPTSGESAPTALAPATADDISVLPVEPLPTNPEQFEQGIGSEIIPTSESNPATAVVRTPKEFTSGVFTVGETGEVGIDFLFDGGKYQGEVAIFSLSGLDEFELGSPELISEVAHRALSNSASGYVAISDHADGAEFSGKLGESVDWNEGEYESKTFAMKPSERFGIMLVPNGTVAEVAENPTLAGAKRPLFSMATDDPDDGFHGQQFADVTGDGVLFAWEDLRLENWSDRDYNDIIFSIKGATGSATDFDAAGDPEKDWRDTDLGREIIQSVLSPVETSNRPADSKL